MKPEWPPSRGKRPRLNNPATSRRPKRFDYAFVLSFFILFALWVVLSGRFDGFHICMGLLSSALVAAISGDLMFSSPGPRGIFGLWMRLAGYIPWLVCQIMLANLHVLYLTFHPRMMDLIDPQIIEFDSRLNGDYARMLFANSITLTPGTITVDVTALGRFSVHCINERSATSLPGKMEDKLVGVFAE